MGQHDFRTQDGLRCLEQAKHNIDLALVAMQVNPETYRRDADEAAIFIQQASGCLLNAIVQIMRDR